MISIGIPDDYRRIEYTTDPKTGALDVVLRIHLLVDLMGAHDPDALQMLKDRIEGVVDDFRASISIWCRDAE